MPADTPELPVLEKISLRGFTLDVNYYLKADYSDISIAAGELPAVMEWVNECLHDLREQGNVLKAELAEAEARAYFDLTGTGDGSFAQNYNAPGGKLTAEAMGNAVALDRSVGEKKRELARVSGWCQRLAGLQQSFQAKLDLVRSTESTRRAVFGSDPDS